MRIMALVLGSTLMVFAAYSEAVAARYGNPDRNYSQSAAGVCGGSASCYRNGSHKVPKKH